MQELGPNQEKWLQALESGNWNQVSGRLGDHRGHCCIGVACEVMGLQHKRDEDGDFVYDGASGNAPQSLVEWLALHDEEGSAYEPDDDMSSLVELNDCEKCTFKKIAEAVRANPPAYFREPR